MSLPASGLFFSKNGETFCLWRRPKDGALIVSRMVKEPCNSLFFWEDPRPATEAELLFAAEAKLLEATRHD